MPNGAVASGKPRIHEQPAGQLDRLELAVVGLDPARSGSWSRTDRSCRPTPGGDGQALVHRVGPVVTGPWSRWTELPPWHRRGFQPSIVAVLGVEEKHRRARVALPVVTTKPVDRIEDLPGRRGPVTFTTRRALATDVAVAPVYSVALSEPLSATHSGEPGSALVPGDAASPTR